MSYDFRKPVQASKRPTLEAYLAKYRKRHREPAKQMPARVLEKSTGGSSGHGEAQQHGDEIWLFPKFWEHDEKLRDWIMTHEIGHYCLTNNNTKARAKAEQLGIDPWDTPNLPYGQFNFDEAFADCFAAYYLERQELQTRYPAWLRLVEAIT
jgi:hypothetical protein